MKLGKPVGRRVHKDNAEKMRRRREMEAQKRAALLAEVFAPKEAKDGCTEVAPHQKQRCSVTKLL